MKKKREIDWEYIGNSIIMWLAIFALLLAMSMAIFSCSVAFIKGHDNEVIDSETVDASGEELELLGEHNKTKKLKTDEVIKDTIQPIEMVKDSIQLDTVLE